MILSRTLKFARKSQPSAGCENQKGFFLEAVHAFWKTDTRLRRIFGGGGLRETRNLGRAMSQHEVGTTKGRWIQKLPQSRLVMAATLAKPCHRSDTGCEGCPHYILRSRVQMNGCANMLRVLREFFQARSKHAPLAKVIPVVGRPGLIGEAADTCRALNVRVIAWRTQQLSHGP